jgi:hypothetical protein
MTKFANLTADSSPSLTDIAVGVKGYGGGSPQDVGVEYSTILALLASSGNTILSSLITPFTNSGTAGGGGSYIDIGGIKILFFRSTQLTLSGSGEQVVNAATVIFPFTFNSILGRSVNAAGGFSNTEYQYANFDNAPSDTQANVNLVQTSGANGTGQVEGIIWGT